MVNVQHGYGGVLLGETARDLECGIGAAVLGDDDFTGVRLGLNEIQCGRECCGQALFLVVRRETMERNGGSVSITDIISAIGFSGRITTNKVGIASGLQIWPSH